jgi:hypothetical protein
MAQKYFVRVNGDARFYGNKDECEKYVEDHKELLMGHLWCQPEPVITIEPADPAPRRAWDEGGYYCDYSY